MGTARFRSAGGAWCGGGAIPHLAPPPLFPLGRSPSRGRCHWEDYWIFPLQGDGRLEAEAAAAGAMEGQEPSNPGRIHSLVPELLGRERQEK